MNAPSREGMAMMTSHDGITRGVIDQPLFDLVIRQPERGRHACETWNEGRREWGTTEWTFDWTVTVIAC